MRLSKWQGIGNDYLIIDEAELPGELTETVIGALCDRNYGVGADGVLLHSAPSGETPEAVARMRVFNPDGSEPEMCGNGIRMFARYLSSRGLVDGKEFVVETLAGPMRPTLVGQYGVRVDMGLARFNSANISPETVRITAGSGAEQTATEAVESVLEAGGAKYRFTFVDVGNPHCVIQVDDPASFDVHGVGALVERHAFFPNRTNVEFVRVEDDGSARMRVWERGVGETKACGTGATAVGAALVRLGRAISPVLVHLPGGDLTIEAVSAEDEGDGAAMHAYMSGPAEESFTAEIAEDLMLRLGWR